MSDNKSAEAQTPDEWLHACNKADSAELKETSPRLYKNIIVLMQNYAEFYHRQQSEWISVEKELPQEGGRVLLYCEREYPHSPSVIIAFYNGRKPRFEFTSSALGDEEVIKPIAWQPIPAPPTKGPTS